MNIVFKTETGSTYEVDMVRKNIRRVEGMTDPTPRMGTDGEWKPYVDISTPTVGLRVLVVWRIDVEDDKSTVFRSTATSEVVDVLETETTFGLEYKS